MHIIIPAALHEYTAGRSQLEADGQTVAELLQHLNQQCPGIRFRIIDEQDRIRPHMRIFLDSDIIKSIDSPARGKEMSIICALSGG